MAEDARVVRLPAAVVALANDGARDRVADARTSAAGAFVEVPRILLEQRWQRDVGDHRARDSGRIQRRVPFRIPVYAIAEAAEVAARMLNAGSDSRSDEGHRIGNGFPAEMQLLP